MGKIHYTPRDSTGRPAMRIFLGSLLIFLMLTIPASAQVDNVFKSVEVGGGHWVIQLLFAVIFALIALTWRTHKSEYERYKTTQENIIGKLNERIDDSLKREDFTRMQTSIFSALDGLKGDISRWRAEDANRVGDLFKAVEEDFKDQRSESRRISDEVWKQINTQRERLSQFEVITARNYHTKEEIENLLDDKLDPIQNSLEKLLSRYH